MSQFDINHKKIVLKNKTRRPVKKNKSNNIILCTNILDLLYKKTIKE